MKKLKGINVAIIILSAILLLVLGFGYKQINNNKIAKDTYIKGINVGGLSKEEAKEKINDSLKFDNITFTYKDEKWEIEPIKIEASYDIYKTINNAFLINRNKNIFTNILNMIKSNFGTQNDVDIIVNYNEEKIKKELLKIAQEIDMEMKNASINISSDKIKISEAKAGIQLDIDSTILNLKKSLKEGIYKENLVVTKIEPVVLEEDLKNIDTLIGSYKTTIIDKSAGRVENIKLAINRTSGVLLMPGEEFSYNYYTGERTTANGYKNATVIVNGEGVQGVGGGVCQVSTTLYNAVLYAGLDVVKVSNHSIPSSYVQKGRDAAVSNSGLDFIFKNNYNEPVYIQNYYSNGNIICQIYGSKENKKNIEIVTNTDKIVSPSVKEEKDETLLEGEKKVIKNGRSAYTVSTYRVYYDENGKETKREKVATSYYPPKQKVVAIGTLKEEYIAVNDENNQQSENNESENNQVDNLQDSNISDTTQNDNISDNISTEESVSSIATDE